MRNFLLLVRSKSAFPSAYELAIGFSLQTFIPATTACLFGRPCSCISVSLNSRSNFGFASILSICGKLLGMLYSFALRAALSEMISQALSDSTYDDFERCGRYWVDTLPQP